MRQQEWGKVSTHRAHAVIDMPFVRDRTECEYVMLLDLFVRSIESDHSAPASMLRHSQLELPYECLPFLSGDKMWEEAIRFEVRHRTNEKDAFFVGCHNREVLMVFASERVKLYALVPAWWKKYELCRALQVRTSSLLAYVTNVFVQRLPSCAMLYRSALADHYIMVMMSFLQRVWLHDDKKKYSGFDLRMSESVYKVTWFLCLMRLLSSLSPPGSTILSRGRDTSPS